MKEYRTGQRLKCIKELSVWYYPSNWSPIEKYTVHIGDTYMIVEKISYEDGRIGFTLAPLRRGDIFLDIWNYEGRTTLDDYFEACN